MNRYTFTITVERHDPVSEKRLDHLLSRVEDIFNSRDFDLYDSSWEKEEAEDSDPDDFTCPHCKGTGEGLTDRTRCKFCHGTGDLKLKEILERR